MSIFRIFKRIIGVYTAVRNQVIANIAVIQTPLHCPQVAKNQLLQLWSLHLNTVYYPTMFRRSLWNTHSNTKEAPKQEASYHVGFLWWLWLRARSAAARRLGNVPLKTTAYSHSISFVAVEFIILAKCTESFFMQALSWFLFFFSFCCLVEWDDWPGQPQLDNLISVQA